MCECFDVFAFTSRAPHTWIDLKLCLFHQIRNMSFEIYFDQTFFFLLRLGIIWAYFILPAVKKRAIYKNKWFVLKDIFVLRQLC